MSAARRSGRSYPVSADVSIKSSQRSTLRDAQPLFPTGPCNFRDLSAGHVCGCRRFWSSQSSASGRIQDNDQRDASCICGHHGCFHDLGHENVDGLSRQHTPLYRPAIASIETSEAFEIDATKPRWQVSSLLDRNIAGGSEQRTRIHVDTSPEAIDVRSQTTGSAGSRLHLQQHIRQDLRSSRSSATEIASTPTRTAWLESRTATRSALDIVKSGLRTLDIGKDAASDKWSRASSINPAQAGPKRISAQPPHTEQLHEQLNALKALVLSVPDVGHALSGIYARLDAIESITSSQEVPEDLAERIELLDNLEVRTIELEARLNSFDSARSFHDDHPSIDALQRIPRGDSEEQSDVLLDRLNDIEQRLISIEGHSLPSSQLPWSVEVVVIPWGAELNGLWFPDNTGSTWVQMMGNSPYRSAERHIARACGPSDGEAGLVYSRLLSCGLVRVVQLFDNSAHHVQSQLQSTFSDIVPTILSLAQDKLLFQTQMKEQFLGLQSPLIPLRKIHRESTLQYLSPAEMVTPVLWTASFLESSVFMKAPRAGIRRLYMTTPDGYTQPTSSSGRCDWMTLRKLSTAFNNASLSYQGGDTDCWAWNRRLDPLPVDSIAVLHNAHHTHTSRSSSPIASNHVPPQKRGLRLPMQHQTNMAASPNVKNEPVSDEDITYMPITPTSIFPSSQAQSKHSRKQSPAHQPSDSRVSTSPILSRSAPSSQKRALTSSFDSYASVESGQARISDRARPSSQSYHIQRQRANKRTRHAQHSPLRPETESGQRQNSSSNPTQANAALAYATPYSWNPVEDTPKRHEDSHLQSDSGDTEPVHSSSSIESESEDDDEDADDDDDDDDSNDKGAPASSAQTDFAGGSARRAARLISSPHPILLPNSSIERGGNRQRHQHVADEDLPLAADPEDEHGHENEDDSMDEDGFVDEDDAMIEDEADNDDDDEDDFDDEDGNDDSHEMKWH